MVRVYIQISLWQGWVIPRSDMRVWQFEQCCGGAWHITSRFNLIWIARNGLLPGGPCRRRLDIHFSAFAPWDSHYRSSFANRFACEGEKGKVIYVPVTALKDIGACLASNGVILCRSKIPFTAIQAIFKLDGARGMGPRIQSPSLVDEYVCESIFGKDCYRASPKYIKKIAEPNTTRMSRFPSPFATIYRWHCRGFELMSLRNQKQKSLSITLIEP